MTLFYHKDFIISNLMFTFRLDRFGELHLRPPFPTPQFNPQSQHFLLPHPVSHSLSDTDLIELCGSILGRLQMSDALSTESARRESQPLTLN